MRNTICASFFLGLLTLTCLNAQAAEPYAAYDGFSTSPIDPDRWIGFDRIRAVQQGGLRLAHRAQGDQYLNSGTRRTSNGVDMINPDTVTQMRATLRVTSMEAIGCDPQVSTNGEPADAQARLIGSFFARQVGSPGNQTHDVIALARLTRRSNSGDGLGVLRVEGVVLECTNSDCSTTTNVEVADLGTATLDEAVNLWMVWDQANSRFRFSRDGSGFVNVAYEGSDDATPNTPFKSLQSRTILPNCLSGARSSGFVDARFDNFQVNVSAVP